MDRATSRIAVAVALLSCGVGAPARAAVLDGAHDDLEVLRWPSASTVHDLAQGEDGRLWLATESGLQVFDGASWREDKAFHRVLPAPLHGRDLGVRRLLFDDAGGLWLATGSGIVLLAARDDAATPGRSAAVELHGVARLGALVRVPGPGPLGWPGDAPLPERVALPGSGDEPSRWVWALARGAPGELWLGTGAGLWRFRGGDPGRATLAPVALPGPPPFVTAIAAAPDEVWVGASTGLYHVLPATGPAAGTIEQRLDLPVRALARSEDGALWLATPWSVLRQLGDVRTEFALAQVEVLHATGARVWAGSSEGLHRLAPDGGVERWTRADGLPDDRVIALLEDREGSLWVGTRAGGLAQLRRRRARNLGQAEGFPGSGLSTLRARDGAIWVTTSEAVVRWQDQRATVYRNGREFPSFSPRGMSEGSDGRIWFATEEAALVTWDGRRFARVELPAGAPPRRPAGVVVDREGDLWVGWREGGASRFRGARVRAAEAQDHVAPEGCAGPAGLLAAGPDGQVWLGSLDGGVMGWSGGELRCYTTADGLAPGALKALMADAHGRVWLGSRDRLALTVLVDGRARRVPLRGPPGAESVLALVEAADGGLIVGTERGVIRLGASERERCATAVCADPVGRVVVGPGTGVAVPEITATFAPTGARDDLGRVWLPTLLGVALLVDPESEALPRVSTRLAAVRAGGRPLPIPVGLAELDLTAAPFASPLPAQAPIEIACFAAYLRAPEEVRFQHRRVGHGDWSAPGAGCSLLLASLPAGVHEVEVRAVHDAHGPLGPPARVRFEVVAPWYARPQTHAAAALLALLALLAGHRLRVARVRARYRAVAEERARIAREVHDTLAQGFTSLAYLLDAARLSRPEPPEGVRAILRDARAVLDACQEEARQAIGNLRATRADDAPLPARLRDLVARAERLGPARLSFAQEGTPGPLPAFVTDELLRVTQEALTNAQRHAQATRIEVRLACTPDELMVSVRDDGVGIARATDTLPTLGHGVLGMHERAARIGARLSVSGEPGQGTQVVIVVPLRAGAGARSPWIGEA